MPLATQLSSLSFGLLGTAWPWPGRLSTCRKAGIGLMLLATDWLLGGRGPVERSDLCWGLIAFKRRELVHQ